MVAETGSKCVMHSNDIRLLTLFSLDCAVAWFVVVALGGHLIPFRETCGCGSWRVGLDNC